MDAGTLGSIMTVIFFVLFIAIVWWAFHRENKGKFEDAANVQAKMKTLNIVGHGYTEAEIAEAPKMLEGKTEMDALIAYLQVLGTSAPKAK